MSEDTDRLETPPEPRKRKHPYPAARWGAALGAYAGFFGLLVATDLVMRLLCHT